MTENTNMTEPQDALTGQLDVAAAQAALADPGLPAASLAEIAASQPSLWPAVVAHPNAYPQLLDWLAAQGDETVRTAVAQRLAAGVPGVLAATPAQSLRKSVLKLSLILVAALITMQLVVPTVMEILIIFLNPALREKVMQAATSGADLGTSSAAITAALGPYMGAIMIVAAAAGACWYFALRGRRLVTTDLTTTRPVAGRWPLLGKAAIFFFAGQSVTMALTSLISLTGYDPSTVMSSLIDPIAQSALGLAYITVIGPVLEELVFRGAILRHLAPYGVNFAIVTQAVLFGLYHLNLYQGIFAFLVGLMLGYVAVNFSIKWAMLLHICNNSLTLLPNTATVNVVFTVVAVIVGLAALFIAITDRERGRPLITAGRSALVHPFRIGWTQPLFLVVVVVMLVLSTLVMILM